ncbi:MAG: RNase adapter RapZ [Eubacteriales bacterium]
MEFIIVTGLSGAGKSNALTTLEDMGFFCVDNMPIPLISKFAQLGTSNHTYQRVALVADIRAGNIFSALLEAVEELKNQGHSCAILYMDADDKTIVKRYKETRRSHPLSGETANLLEAIAKERQMLSTICLQATYVMNTGVLSYAKLKDELYRLFSTTKTTERQLDIRISSFGFKHGLPIDADLVFDVRFLPNPFYEASLRPKTGLDQEVRDYVFSNGQGQEFLDKLQDMVLWLLPLYRAEGKHALVVAIGCTGGHHRSVTLAHLLSKILREEGYAVTESHRDLGKH